MTDPFKSATRTGGEFLDLRELCADEPTLALFKIVEFGEREPDNYKRWTYPVTADVLICSGPRTGEVHKGEVFKFAPANVLRGVSAKASEQGAEPTNAPGEQIAARVTMVEKKGSQPFVGLDPVSGPEREAIAAVWNGGAGWTGKTLATAGATSGASAADGGDAASGTSRPWK